MTNASYKKAPIEPAQLLFSQALNREIMAPVAATQRSAASR
jgi:hypothetical protein